MIDTHAHIDDEQYADDIDSFILNQQQAGVSRILVPATNADSCLSVLSLCARYPDYCVPALGLHPEDVSDDYLTRLQAIHSLILCHRNRLCAIGEIGLDYHFSTLYKEQQLDAFRQQMQWALDLDLPVMIHSRDATDDCLRIVEEYAAQGLRGVMHCFSGSYETAQRILRTGFYMGIGGVITFKNAHLALTLSGNGRPPIPLERLVLETDSPYMAPVPHRGQRNESRYLTHVIDVLAHTYNTTSDLIDRITTNNARQLFHLS